MKVFETMVCPGGPHNCRNCEASVIELADGRLLLGYSHFGSGGGDYDVGDIRARFSDDGGYTWTEPVMVQETDGRHNMRGVDLMRLKSGDIGLIYGRSLMGEDRVLEEHLLFRTSGDDGRTWGPEKRIGSIDWNRIVLHDQALRLQGDRIIVPLTVMASAYGPYTTSNENGAVQLAAVLYTDDEGETWRQSTALMGDDLIGCNEPSAVELKDGRLLMFMRTCLGRVYKTYSEDRGETWTRPLPTTLATFNSPQNLKRIPASGDLLIVWNQCTPEEAAMGIFRHRLSTAVSRDEGETWGCFKNLESLDDRTCVEPSEVKMYRGGRFPGVYPPGYREGYINASYSSVVFTGAAKDRAVVTYGVAPAPHHSLKLKILPVDWFYT